MSLIEATADIQARIELVFEISQDYSVRYERDSSLTRICAHPSTTSGPT